MSSHRQDFLRRDHERPVTLTNRCGRAGSRSGGGGLGGVPSPRSLLEALSTAPATFALLVVNVAVSLYALFVSPALAEAWALRPYAIVHGKEYQRLFTGSFIHAGLGHLLFNMVTLYFFGPTLEDQLGTGRFLVLYFGAELASSLFTVWRRKADASYAAVGASGAISGLVFAFCLFAPFARLYVFFAIPMPAILFALVYTAGSIYAMRQSEARQGGGIAHEAHLGGAIGGVVLTLLLYPAVGPHFVAQIATLLR